ncbi:DgyrCDS9587 [Dimorphilus gyrociliatus]|uniref:DgyrCDS9587 n=1 Tax=Dimorphilus gyrociliatus TaxID=2664684 RepID=A0A7I8W2Q5_9ANNE|nr:DgyrCDS9587 [Dimorphilus gyrociliatus]
MVLAGRLTIYVTVTIFEMYQVITIEVEADREVVQRNVFLDLEMGTKVSAAATADQGLLQDLPTGQFRGRGLEHTLDPDLDRDLNHDPDHNLDTGQDPDLILDLDHDDPSQKDQDINLKNVIRHRNEERSQSIREKATRALKVNPDLGHPLLGVGHIRLHI